MFHIVSDLRAGPGGICHFQLEIPVQFKIRQVTFAFVLALKGSMAVSVISLIWKHSREGKEYCSC
jgi:hypothetical protein